MHALFTANFCISLFLQSRNAVPNINYFRLTDIPLYKSHIFISYEDTPQHVVVNPKSRMAETDAQMERSTVIEMGCRQNVHIS